MPIELKTEDSSLSS